MKTLLILSLVLTLAFCQSWWTPDREEKVGDDCSEAMCDTENPLKLTEPSMIYNGDKLCCDSSKYSVIEEYTIPCGPGVRCPTKPVCSCI